MIMMIPPSQNSNNDFMDDSVNPETLANANSLAIIPYPVSTDAMPLAMIPPSNGQFSFGVIPLQNVFSDDESIRANSLTIEELSRWLGEASNDWVEELARHVDLNTLTLQQILDIHMNYALQVSLDEDEIQQRDLPLPDITNARLEDYYSDWDEVARSIRNQIAKFPNLNDEEVEEMFESLTSIAGYPSEPSDVSNWRFSDSDSIISSPSSSSDACS
ncbi:hypothetical protein LIER_08517 [Lithospermum erythrorhizon]|uniref:Uncharacterized protein n=1 Tax=Lithospermum erythrorhizon TaxID=34254 RepID=A0AAV3PCD4_LITER